MTAMTTEPEFIVLRTYPARIHAELARSALMARDLHCVIVGGEFNTRATIRLFVRAEDAERALEILGPDEPFSM
jgi:hypothetical protein